MNGKKLLAIILAMVILLLLYFSAMGYSKADGTTNARLIFDDPSLENNTYAAMNFYDMDNITSANISIEIDDLQEGNIWAFYETESQNGTNTNQSLMLELYYLNGMLHLYKYKTLSYEQETRTVFWPTTIYRLIVNSTGTHTDTIVGYAHDGDILRINYHLTKEDGTGYASATDTIGNISITITIENSTYSYNSHTDSDNPIFKTGFATTPTTVNGTYTFSRGMMFGSFDDTRLGKSEFSIDNMEYKAYLFSNITHNITENFTLYYDHFFHTGETLTHNNSIYAVFEISSPARIYVLDEPISAAAGPLIISPSWTITIKDIVLENLWWIVPLLFGLLIVDIWIDAHDMYQDKKGGKS